MKTQELRGKRAGRKWMSTGIGGQSDLGVGGIDGGFPVLLFESWHEEDWKPLL